jgi:hypothetical protein
LALSRDFRDNRREAVNLVIVVDGVHWLTAPVPQPDLQKPVSEVGFGYLAFAERKIAHTFVLFAKFTEI